MTVLHFLIQHLLICITTEYLWKRLRRLFWALVEKHILLPLTNLIFAPLIEFVTVLGYAFLYSILVGAFLCLCSCRSRQRLVA